jgi:hypothetical protein
MSGEAAAADVNNLLAKVKNKYIGAICDVAVFPILKVRNISLKSIETRFVSQKMLDFVLCEPR